MERGLIGTLLIVIVTIFGFFSLPAKWQIRILQTMQGWGQNFTESTDTYIQEKKYQEYQKNGQW